MRKINWFWVTFLATVGLLFFLPPFDPDLGWQLRCGQQIWQGQGCFVNNFSALLANYRWDQANSLYQLLLYPIFEIAGVGGLSVLNSLVGIGIFWFWWKLAGNKEIKTVLLPVVVGLSWMVVSLGIRSQVVSGVFLMSLLYFLEQYLKNPGRRNKIAIILIMWLWANSHGSFVLGLGVIGVLLVSLLWQRAGKRFAMIAIIALGVTLLNPLGYQIYSESWRHFFVVPLNLLIAEWTAPPLWVKAVVLVMGIGAGVVMWQKQKGRGIWRLVVLGVLMIMALKARRNVMYFGLFAGYLLSWVEIKTPTIKRAVKTTALLILMIMFLFALLIRLPLMIMADTNFYGQHPIKYPTGAVEYLKMQAIKGNIYNRYEWGGLLIWELPEYKVFVDGRMPAWQTSSGKSPYTIYLETLQNQPGWQETLNEYKIDWILISPGTFMDLLLAPNPQQYGWEEKYRDAVSVIYFRPV